MEFLLQPPDWWRLNTSLRTLVGARSPSISAYVPAGKEARFLKVLERPPREAPEEPDTAPVAAALRKALEAHGPVHGTLCLFGWGPDAPEVRSIEVPAKLRHSYGVAPEPFVGPLRELLEPRCSFVLVQVNHHDATVRRYEGLEVVGQKRVRSYVERHHKKGGASAGRYQRGQQEQVHQHLVNVRRTLGRFIPGADLILVGGPGTAKVRFMELLGAAPAPRARQVEGMGPTTSGKEFYRLLREALDAFRLDEEFRFVERAVEGTRAGLLLTDAGGVARALEAGAVEALLVAADARDVDGVVARMVEAAGRSGARVEFITRAEPRARLRRHGEVAARLRYPWKKDS
ncbi:MAG: Vms1/Ankzf1 family peptidyl-tRNA hydrolase [Halobacteria archaeon]